MSSLTAMRGARPIAAQVIEVRGKEFRDIVWPDVSEVLHTNSFMVFAVYELKKLTLEPSRAAGQTFHDVRYVPLTGYEWWRDCGNAWPPSRQFNKSLSNYNWWMYNQNDATFLKDFT